MVIEKIRNGWRERGDTFPITSRGLTLLVFLTALLLCLGFNRADIIASSLSFALLGLAICLCLVSTYLRSRYKRLFELSFSPPDDCLIAQQASHILMSVNKRSIPLTHRVVISPLGEASACIKPQIFVGNISPETLMSVTCTPPHRGYWSLQRFSCEVRDIFGISSLRWTLVVKNSNTRLTVLPAGLNTTSAKLSAASEQAGEDLIDSKDRRGEPFDLKSYDPADGARRIVWKIFARTGQLITRQAEPSITPDGLVYLYALADKEQDALAAEFLAYVRFLEQNELEYYAGCSGMRDKKPVSNVTALQDLLLSSVWQASNDPTQIKQELTTLCSLDSNQAFGRRSLVLFLSRYSEAPTFLEESLKLLQAHGWTISIISEQHVPAENLSSKRATRKLKQLLFEIQKQEAINKKDQFQELLKWTQNLEMIPLNTEDGVLL